MGTKIEWAGETWNPVVGCSKISEGCRNCYAERIALAYGWSPKPWKSAYAPENVMMKHNRLDVPKSKKAGTVYFVNSMSDLFHPVVTDTFIDKIFQVMAQTPRHFYLILTKRPERMQAYAESRNSILPNVGLGVSVEDQWSANQRMPLLVETPAAMRFVSVEPLLHELTIYEWINRVQWVIAGGESGPGARSCHEEWLRHLRDVCGQASVPFFLKQLGGHPEKRGGNEALLDGKLWHEVPAALEKYWRVDEPVQGRLF